MKIEFSFLLNTTGSIPPQLLREPRNIKSTSRTIWKTWKENHRKNNREWPKCSWDNNREESDQTCLLSLFLLQLEWISLRLKLNPSWWLHKWWCQWIQWCQWWHIIPWWWIQWWTQWCQGLSNLCNHIIHLAQAWWVQDSVLNLHRSFPKCNLSNLSQHQSLSRLLLFHQIQT